MSNNALPSFADTTLCSVNDVRSYLEESLVATFGRRAKHMRVENPIKRLSSTSQVRGGRPGPSTVKFEAVVSERFARSFQVYVSCAVLPKGDVRLLELSGEMTRPTAKLSLRDGGVRIDRDVETHDLPEQRWTATA